MDRTSTQYDIEHTAVDDEGSDDFDDVAYGDDDMCYAPSGEGIIEHNEIPLRAQAALAAALADGGDAEILQFQFGEMRRGIPMPSQ